MKRKEFLKNALMAIAISLLPKVLHPSVPEVEEEAMVNVPVEFIVNWKFYSETKKFEKTYDHVYTMNFQVPESKAEQFKKYMQGLYNSEQNPERSVASKAK